MPLDTGKITGNPLKRSIIKQLHSKHNEVVMGAVTGVDCALFSFQDSSCVAVQLSSPISLSACDRPEITSDGYDLTIDIFMDRVVGDIMAAGADPVAVELTLLLPQGTEETELRGLIQAADRAAKDLKVQLAGVNASVSPNVTKAMASAVGLGSAEASRTAHPGQDIVITKWIGLEGTAILAARHRDKLLERLPEYFVNKAEEFKKLFSIIPEAALARKSGAGAMHPLGEGGILAALWEIAEASGVGLTIDMKKIPLKQETVEICEICEANPYQLLSFGSLMIITDNGDDLVAGLEQAGIQATVIGSTNSSSQRIITNEDEVRYLDRPKCDEIYRL